MCVAVREHKLNNLYRSMYSSTTTPACKIKVIRSVEMCMYIDKLLIMLWRFYVVEELERLLILEMCHLSSRIRKGNIEFVE